MILSNRIFIALLSAAFAIGAGAAEKKPATPAAGAKPTPAEKGETVDYDDLHLHVGQKVVVHTKYKSTRTGTLLKASKVELTLSIDTPDGPSQMTIPKETIANVIVVSPDPTK